MAIMVSISGETFGGFPYPCSDDCLGLKVCSVKCGCFVCDTCNHHEQGEGMLVEKCQACGTVSEPKHPHSGYSQATIFKHHERDFSPFIGRYDEMLTSDIKRKHDCCMVLGCSGEVGNSKYHGDEFYEKYIEARGSWVHYGEPCSQCGSPNATHRIADEDEHEGHCLGMLKFYCPDCAIPFGRDFPKDRRNFYRKTRLLIEPIRLLDLGVVDVIGLKLQRDSGTEDWLAVEIPLMRVNEVPHTLRELEDYLITVAEGVAMASRKEMHHSTLWMGAGWFWGNLGCQCCR